MRVLLGVAGIFLLLVTFFLGLGIGFGYVLHWVLPGVDPGIRVLIALVAIGISVMFLLVRTPDPEEEEYDDFELDESSEAAPPF